MKEIKDRVTIVMTAHAADAFAQASIYSIRQYYPGMRIILADSGYLGGAPVWRNSDAERRNRDLERETDTIVMPGMCAEDCRNAAAALVETQFILFMDDDVKILGPDSIEILIAAIEEVAGSVQTGAYCLKVTDWLQRKGYVSTVFDRAMAVDACPCYFSLHTTAPFLSVGGMPKHDTFYPADSESDIYTHVQRNDLAGYGGDFVISNRYKHEGLLITSPRERVAVLHWGQRFRVRSKTDLKSRFLEDWWYKNTTHVRCDPLNKFDVFIKKEGM